MAAAWVHFIHAAARQSQEPLPSRLLVSTAAAALQLLHARGLVRQGLTGTILFQLSLSF